MYRHLKLSSQSLILNRLIDSDWDFCISHLAFLKYKMLVF